MKVLIVEDSLVMRRLLRSSLQKWQYEVTEAEDGAQAWELFQHEHFPLVLTDWLMPEMDGLELTRRIRECELPSYVYIILLTAKSEKEDLVTAMMPAPMTSWPSPLIRMNFASGCARASGSSSWN